MAFKDMEVVLYGGKVKLDYKDKSHRYYYRVLQDDGTWGKATPAKGVTTLMGDTLEKKALMHWSKGLALRELFGYYDFVAENGVRKQGFSKDVGTIWGQELDKETLIPIIESADKAWARITKQGADIGTVVHDAIEHHIKANTNNPDIEPTPSTFDIEYQYMWNIKDSIPDHNSPEFTLAMENFELEVEMAKKAYQAFIDWWSTVSPMLYGAEELLFSLKNGVAGTYDATIGIPIEHHPRPEMFEGKKHVRCMTDWKTSKASENAGAPQGVYYSYFIQLGIYEGMRREMGLEPCEDIAVASARKDGGFNIVFASELGISIEDCVDWGQSVMTCYFLMDKTKKELINKFKMEK